MSKKVYKLRCVPKWYKLGKKYAISGYTNHNNYKGQSNCLSCGLQWNAGSPGVFSTSWPSHTVADEGRLQNGSTETDLGLSTFTQSTSTFELSKNPILKSRELNPFTNSQGPLTKLPNCVILTVQYTELQYLVTIHLNIHYKLRRPTMLFLFT